MSKINFGYPLVFRGLLYYNLGNESMHKMQEREVP